MGGKENPWTYVTQPTSTEPEPGTSAEDVCSISAAERK